MSSKSIQSSMGSGCVFDDIQMASAARKLLHYSKHSPATCDCHMAVWTLRSGLDAECRESEEITPFRSSADSRQAYLYYEKRDLTHWGGALSLGCVELLLAPGFVDDDGHGIAEV